MFLCVFNVVSETCVLDFLVKRQQILCVLSHSSGQEANRECQFLEFHECACICHLASNHQRKDFIKLV